MSKSEPATTEKVFAWAGVIELPAASTNGSHNDSHEIPHWYQSDRERAYWIKHVRIYELAPTLKDPEALTVLADLFEQANRASVDALIKDIGIVGQWRPSTILIESLINLGTTYRLIVSQPIIAHALWNVDLGDDAWIPPSCGLSMRLCNDEDRKRVLRVHLIAELYKRPEDE